jgi:hypothetical protein
MISQHATLAAVALATFAMGFSAQPRAPQAPSQTQQTTSRAPSGSVGAERHLANIKQLTTGGENAEAYF